MRHVNNSDGFIKPISIIIFFVTLFAGWLTHVIVTIQSAQWLLLIAGAIMAPIGIIHGWGLWFGAW